jgi:D-alanyl-D-alanine dipeptidase
MAVTPIFRPMQKIQLLVILLGFFTSTYSQQIDFKTIKNIKSLDSVHSLNNEIELIEVGKRIKNPNLDLRYATKNNFTKQRMYPASTRKTYLLKPALDALQRALADFEKAGYGIKIFDAYRPYAVTVHFWELIHDERYVANPKNGSGHNKGIAIDLTLVNLSSGEELPMGTGFDNFTDSAHHSFTQLSKTILSNRNLLKSTMEKHGFVALESEWWHYSLPNPKQYPVLDISFKELRKL